VGGRDPPHDRDRVIRNNDRVIAVPSAQLAAELTRAGAGDVDISTRRRAEYSSDASNYRVVPGAVVFPRHRDEVEAVLAVCRRLGVAVTCRGAGTSIAGNAIGSGVVIDFSRHLHRVLAVDPDSRTASVEAGAILDSVTAAGARHGLRFGPDPSTHSRATIGGSLGNNACGSRALGYGRTADNVVDLDVLTAAGVRFTARSYGRHGLPARDQPEMPMIGALDDVVRDRLGMIRTEFGRFSRQVSGYSLEHLLPEHGFDVARFLVGSEGTLGVVTRATVRLTPAPAGVALVILGYPDMASAAEAVPALLPHRPLALEGLDARLVEVVRRRRGVAAVPALPRGGGWLFAETGGATVAEAVAAGRGLIAAAGAQDAAVVTGPGAAALWRIREDGAGLGSRTPDGAAAWPGWEDAAVPPDRLARYLREFEALLARYQFDALTYGHFGDGCVHARIDFPLRSATGAIREFVEEAAHLVASHGGSLSGEHGDGRARGELLPIMYSLAAIETFAAVKHIFDPENLLNPGVIVRPARLDADLRLPAAKALRDLAFAYPEDRGNLMAAVHRCVGVGKCRADFTATGGVMCPSYLATHDEKDSTRGRARVLQEMANGTLVAGWQAPEVAEALDLCLACKGCASDCPTGIDMATYKSEVLYQRYRRRPRPRSHYVLGWLPRWGRIASRAPNLANVSLRGPGSGLAKRVAGVDGRRPLPKFARRTFRQWFAGHPPADGDPIVLFVDTFTDRYSPQIGQAAVRLLEHAGYSVRAPSASLCCGLTWISTGQLDGARRQLRRSATALEGLLTEGALVVGLEPSCTAVWRSDATDLLPADRHVRHVAANIRTLAEVLTVAAGWRSPDLTGVRGLAQPHCHQRAVLGWEADRSLLTDAGAEVTAVGGCCGLAGNFGVERGHYDVSVAVAEIALLPAVRRAAHDVVLLADGFSCRTQLEHLAGAHSRHLAELLAEHLDGNHS